MLIFSSTTVLAETSKYQAGKSIEEYVTEGEIYSSYGPYTYQDNDYFVVEVIPEIKDNYIGTLFIVDKDDGEIILDRMIYYDVSKMHMITRDISESNYLTLYGDNAMVIRDDISYWDDSQDFWDEVEDIARKTDEKDAAKEASSISKELVINFENELQVTLDMIDALNMIYEGTVTESEVNNYVSLETQLNDNYKNSQNSVNNAIDNFPAIYNEFTDSVSAYGITKSEWEDYEDTDLKNLGNLDDNYRVLIVNGQLYQWVQDDTDWSWESMNDRISEKSESSTSDTSASGFGVIGSILAILTIAFFLKKK